MGLLTRQKRVAPPRPLDRRLSEQPFEDPARLAAIFPIDLCPYPTDQRFEEGCHGAACTVAANSLHPKTEPDHPDAA